MTPSPAQQQPQVDPNDALLARMKDKLRDLLKDHLEGDTDPEKTAQFRMARRNALYWEGKQNIVPVWSANGIADFSATGAPISPGGGKEDFGQFDYPFNFIRGDGLKAISVTGKAPVCNAVPDDPNDEDAAANIADINAYSEHLDQMWKADQIQKDIMFTIWTLGPPFIYTHYVTDGQKHGYHDEPVMETRDVAISDGGYQCDGCGTFIPSDDAGSIQCPQCGRQLDAYQPPQTAPVPYQSGVTRYEKGDVEIEVCDIFTVTTQFDVKKLSQCQYLRYEYEAPKGGLVALFPKLRKKLESTTDPGGGSSAASQVGADARGVASSPTGIRYQRKDRWRYTQDWLLPSMYEYLAEDTDRQQLLQSFPKGLKISSVDGEIQKLEAQKLTDYWAACPPSVGKRLHGDPLCADAIPGQDLYNDGQNMAAETEYHMIPATVVDNQVFDKEAMENRPPNPAEMIFVNLQGQDPHKLMANLPVSSFSEQLLPWLNGVRDTMRENTGTTRAIAGLDGDTKTAEEARLRQNAALKQLSVAYDNTRHLWPEVRTNAVREAARFGIGKIKAPIRQGLLGQEARTVDLSNLALTGWHFEVDEGMPASFADERDRVNKLLIEAPTIAHMVNLDHPVNAPAVARYVGIRGLADPAANERAYVKRTIDRLKKEKRIQQPDGSFQPSIPIRQFADNHQVDADIVRAWCMTDEALELADQNMEAYLNVESWGAAQQAAANPPLPPPPQPPAKLNASLPLDKVDPQLALTVLKDFNLLPGGAGAPPSGAPPAGPGPQGPPPTGPKPPAPMPQVHVDNAPPATAGIPQQPPMMQ